MDFLSLAAGLAGWAIGYLCVLWATDRNFMALPVLFFLLVALG